MVLPLIAVHEVPLVLYSMRFETPVTVSLNVSSTIPVGYVVAALGTDTFFSPDTGAASVAFVRTITVVAVLPNTLRGIVVPVADVQVFPSSRLYSIAVETPVIVSVEPLYAAFGAAPRAGTVTVSGVADTKVVSVALTRTW